MTDHKTGTREEWLAARLELLEAEKALTRRSDELARQRQDLPWVRIGKEYHFETGEGTASLADLFAGRSQLLIYHFMFGPDYTAGCPSCSAIADGFNGSVVHLANHDVTLCAVSRAPLAKLQTYKQRMGWSFPWASSHDSDFNVDYGVSAGEQLTYDPAAPRPEASELALLKLLNEQPAVRENLPRITIQNASSSGTDVDGYFSEGHGVSTFARESGTVYHCYSSYARGTEFLMGYYAILDRAPKGRDEGDQPMSWLRRLDEYERVTHGSVCALAALALRRRPVAAGRSRRACNVLQPRGRPQRPSEDCAHAGSDRTRARGRREDRAVECRAGDGTLEIPRTAPGSSRSPRSPEWTRRPTGAKDPA